MKTAFPYWHNRIAPVFDTACQILIVESEAGLIAVEERVILPDDEPVVKVLRLVELEIGSLVCGALSQPRFKEEDMAEEAEAGCALQQEVRLPRNRRKRKNQERTYGRNVE